MKLVDILNTLSSGDESAFNLLASDKVFSLTTALDKKAQYIEFLSSPFGDRRVLEKAIRSLRGSRKGDKFNPITFVGMIESVTHLWSIQAEVGKNLLVRPHVPKVVTIQEGGSDRLDRTISTFNLDKLFA